MNRACWGDIFVHRNASVLHSNTSNLWYRIGNINVRGVNRVNDSIHRLVTAALGR